MALAEDLTDKEEADELFPKHEREDLMGEKLSNTVIMEAGDTAVAAVQKLLHHLLDHLLSLLPAYGVLLDICMNIFLHFAAEESS